MKKSILTLCLLVQVLFLWAQNQYYVAPDGNDSHDGSLQKPFRTIERAQLKARKAQGETTIYLRKGIYRLERPIIFTPEDGGKEKPLSIRAFRNEQVTLSGGKVLHPVWKPYKKGILTAVLQDDIRYPDMLLSNGNIRHMVNRFALLIKQILISSILVYVDKQNNYHHCYSHKIQNCTLFCIDMCLKTIQIAYKIDNQNYNYCHICEQIQTRRSFFIYLLHNPCQNIAHQCAGK